MRRKRIAGLLVAAVLLEALGRYGPRSWLSVGGMGLILAGLWVFDRWLIKHEKETR